MIFWLLPSVFSAQHQRQLDTLRINAINNLAFLKFDIEDATISEWTTNNNSSDWEELYRCWISDATKFPQTNIVKVCGDIMAPQFNDDISCITVNDAVQLITAPTILNLENANNDLNFLKCVVDNYTRKEITKKIENSKIVATGGGIGEVYNRLKESNNPLFLKFKMLLITDSDCKNLNTPQNDVIRIEAMCIDKKVNHHILERRMIENYFPLELLYKDIPLQNREDVAIYKKVNAFNTLTKEQRYCFHMKKGLIDTNAHSDIYINLDEGILAKLSQAFPDIANKYGQENDQENIHKLMHNFNENIEVKSLAKKVKNHLRTPV